MWLVPDKREQNDACISSAEREEQVTNAQPKENVPALRFPEFTEEWEKCKFGDIATGFDYGMNAAAKPYDGQNKYIRITDIDEASSTYNNEDIVSPDGTLSDNYIVNERDILLARTGASTGKSYLYRNSDGKLYYAGFLIRANIAKHNPYFVFSQLHTHRYWRWVSIMSARSGQPGINSQEYASFPIYTTTLIEENKISTLLSLIDERIATQNKIIEDLKKLKSAIVEMLFCKQGGVLLKLGDIGTFVRGLTYSSEDVTEDINATTVIRANNLNYGNNVNKEDVVYVNKKPAEIQILLKGDIVICMANGSSSLVGKNSYYSFDDRQSTIGAFCGIYRTSQPLVKWLMQSQRYKRLVYQSLQGGNGAIANLNSDDILNMTFHIVEDEKSASILSTLDLIENSIVVNECLKELYSEQKAYLLQHLFI